MSPAQVILKWSVQRGTSVVPKAYGKDHMKANIDILDHADLPAEDMALIDGITKSKPALRFNDPIHYWGFDIYSEERDEPVRADYE